MQNRILFSLVLFFVSSVAWAQFPFPIPNPSQASLVIQAHQFTDPSSCTTADGKLRVTVGLSAENLTTGGGFYIVTQTGETERTYINCLHRF